MENSKQNVSCISDTIASTEAFLNSVKPETGYPYSHSDIGAAELFADCYKDILRYSPERKKWYHYKDGVWSVDKGGDIIAMNFCQNLAKRLCDYATNLCGKYQYEKFVAFVSGWQRHSKRVNILNDARGYHPMSMEMLDRDIYAFNCQNGTLHLDTMEFTQHRPGDMISKISNVIYDPSARCNRFLTFIDEITCGDSEKARFLQKVLGYSLTGDTRYECMFFLYGATTRNGKSTLCESVLKVIGEYGCTVRPETIALNKYANSHAPNEDVARLIGIRFANISEISPTLAINTSQIKSMLGNDTINARFLHENSFDFKIQAKFFVNTNYLPNIEDESVFSSGRIIVIPFTRHFYEHEQDKTLKTLFAQPENQSAILNWLVEGYKMLLEEGLNIPVSIENATSEYAGDSNIFVKFVADKLIEDPDSEIRTMQAYQEYKQWCLDNGYGPVSIQRFVSVLANIVTIRKKRPKTGGNPTGMICGYRLVIQQ